MSESGSPVFMRRLFQGAYYLLVIGFVSIVGYSATVGAFTAPENQVMTTKKDISPESPAGQKCLVDLSRMHARLYSDAHSSFRHVDAKDNEHAWGQVSNQWRAELESIILKCHLKSASNMKPVLNFAKDIERVHMALDTGLRAFRNLAKKPVSRIRKVHEREQALPKLPTE